MINIVTDIVIKIMIKIMIKIINRLYYITSIDIYLFILWNYLWPFVHLIYWNSCWWILRTCYSCLNVYRINYAINWLYMIRMNKINHWFCTYYWLIIGYDCWIIICDWCNNWLGKDICRMYYVCVNWLVIDRLINNRLVIYWLVIDY